ncbi:hypothetical protein F7725_011680 [Dissostichus mawsoni]|uniref:Uncharacterized protein n=1 Tax=Dissostichus mawsoni TaxID=36200 RepID=A0A7J5ZBM7_DISMA|nr:hypothetical protein F7725_011680 [Dissostichus mawsoni]
MSLPPACGEPSSSSPLSPFVPPLGSPQPPLTMAIAWLPNHGGRKWDRPPRCLAAVKIFLPFSEPESADTALLFCCNPLSGSSIVTHNELMNTI